jgi:dephospho-CoA kinase
VGKQFVLYNKDFARSQILQLFFERSNTVAREALSALEHAAVSQAVTHTQILGLLKNIDPARAISVAQVPVFIEHLNRIVREVDHTRAKLQREARDVSIRLQQLNAGMNETRLDI